MPSRAMMLAAAAALLPAIAFAGCPDQATIDAFLADRAAARPAASPLPEGATLEDGLCAQAMVVKGLIPALGPVVGYKAALTSPRAQEMFGVTEPVLGTLLQGMLIENDAVVRPAEAARPLFEADLVVEIADAAVGEATVPEEVLPHIRGVRPFLELPALVLDPGVKIDGPILTAVNGGAWKGVLGDLVAVPEGQAGIDMLAGFTARLTDASGAELSAAPGSAVLGHPLNAVIWVADMLEKQGGELKAGDLVSVGSLGPLHPMKAGMRITVTYEGLPGSPSLSARFE